MKYSMLCALICLICGPLAAIDEAIKIVTTDLLVQYGPQTVPSILETANVSLSGTKIGGTVLVNGDLNASNAQIGTLVVNGNAFLVNCTINNSISVYGNLQMQGTQVAGQLSTYAPFLTIDSSKVSSILVRNNGGQQQTVVIRNGTTINGSITFESGNGIVQLAGGSFVAGALIGGRFK